MVHYRAINHQREFIAYFTPKCGSTTIKDWVLQTFPASQRDKPFHQYLVTPEEAPEYNYQRYLFIRNPLDRLVSFYIQFVVGPDSDWCFLDDKAEITLAEFTFSEFIVALKDHVTQGRQAQHHLKPQARGIQGVTFDQVIPIEDFRTTIGALNVRHGVAGYQMAQLNRTTYNTNDVGQSFDRKPIELDAKHPPLKASFWNDDLRAIAESIYAEDVRLYRSTGRQVSSAQPKSAPHNKTPRPVPRLLLFGNASFSSDYSTNSLLKPRLFEWTSEPDEATEDAVVYTEFSLRAGCGDRPGRRKKIAWLMESPHVTRGLVYDFIHQNTQLVADSFDVLLSSDRSLVEKHPKFVYHPAGSTLSVVPKVEQKIYAKTKLCSMVASPKDSLPGHRKRLEVAQKLQHKLSLFGGAHGSKRLGSHKFFEKSKGLADFCFSVAMENCQVSLYYTEKLTDCFLTGTVPVYWGASEIAEVFDERGIITLTEDFDVDLLSLDLYESMLPYVKNNFMLAQNMESSDDLLFRRYVKN